MPHDITHRRMHPIRRFKQTRICAHVRFRHRSQRAQGPIDVFNTHLSLPSTLSREFWTKPRRLGWGPTRSQRRAPRAIRRQAAHERPVRRGRRLQRAAGSPVYCRLIEEHGWVDAFAQRYRMSVAELVGWPTAGFMRLRMHLDHVFTGRGLRWLDFDDTHAFGDRSAPFTVCPTTCRSLRAAGSRAATRCPAHLNPAGNRCKSGTTR